MRKYFRNPKILANFTCVKQKKPKESDSLFSNSLEISKLFVDSSLRQSVGDEWFHKRTSLATKLAILSSALMLFFVGMAVAAIGVADQIWEHTLGLCMVFSSIILVECIDDKKQFVKDLVNLFK